jgi:transposase
MGKPTYEELDAENQRLRARVADLEEKVRRIEKSLEGALRRSKRQAAPFSKGLPKAEPKPPGRKAGDRYGEPVRRDRPPTVDEVHEAPLPAACPGCGGAVVETHVDRQYQTEIPQRPIYRQFNIRVGECATCRCHLRGRHPLQTSDAVGAATSQLGPLAQAAFVVLNKTCGLSHGKVRRVFRDLFGVAVSRGGVCQAVARMGRKLEPAYQEIAERVKASKVVGADETGWRVGGLSAWMHAAATFEATWYCVAKGRGGDVLEGLLGEYWDGVMVHDGWAPYDRFAAAVHQQCVFHIKTRCKEILTTAVGAARVFPQQALDLMNNALAERDRTRVLDDDGRERLALSYAERLRALVRGRKSNAVNERLARHLEKHLGEWFVFLVDPDVPAANTLGEQAMRPPVVNRKVWGGNRTWIGAQTQSITSSVLDTCQKLGTHVVDFLKHVACGAPAQLFAGS